jgi:Protein of unknown function, DUF547/Domain found in Dishevelled, Egl-10, and Pleckstrin (DEP)
MGQITILTKKDDLHCNSVRLDLIKCHLPFQEIELEPSEPQPVPEIFFDNNAVPGGINELLTILKKWEVVKDSDGQPMLVPIPSNNISSTVGVSTSIVSSNNRSSTGHLPVQHQGDQPCHDRWEETPSRCNNLQGSDGYNNHSQRNIRHYDQNQQLQHIDSNGYREDPRNGLHAGGGIQCHLSGHSRDRVIRDPHSEATYPSRDEGHRDYEHRQEYYQQQRHNRDDFQRRLHLRDNHKQQQPQPRGYYEAAFVPTANRREDFKTSAYDRHSFHGDELRRKVETDMTYHQPANLQSVLDGGYQDNLRTHPPTWFSDMHGSVSVREVPPYHEPGHHGGISANPPIPSSFTDASLAAVRPLPRIVHLPSNSHGDSNKTRNRAPTLPRQPSLRGLADNRRKAFQTSTYQRHSFHGTELFARVKRQERYQDDENPFVRRDASGHSRRNEDSTMGSEQGRSVIQTNFHESIRSSHTNPISNDRNNRDNACSEHRKNSGNEEVNEEDPSESSFADSNDFGNSSDGQAAPGTMEASNHDGTKFHSSQKSLSVMDLRDDSSSKMAPPPGTARNGDAYSSLTSLHSTRCSLHNSRSSPKSTSTLNRSSALLNASQRSLADSISPEDLEEQETSAYGDADDSNRKKPAPLFTLGNRPRATLNRSFRQPSSKTLNVRMQVVERASSMQHTGTRSFVDTAESATGAIADSRLPCKPMESKIPPSRRSVSPPPSVRSNAARTRTAGLRKAALNISNRSLMNDGDDSSSSAWSSSTPIRDDKSMVELPLGQFMSVLDATKELRRIIPSANLKYNLTTYRNSFTGATVADALEEAYGLSRSEAVALGISLHNDKLFFHVCNDHDFEDTSKFFYRLQCQHTPEVLNSFCVWRDETTLTKSAADVMGRAMGKLLPLLAAVTDVTKGRVHYSRATKNHEDAVSELDFAVCELQMVQLARLDKNSLLAFSLNVYQLFLHYAFIKVGIPSSTSAYASFWTSLKFDIGGHLYSFSDWWNGICRGNRKGPYGPKPFQGKDWHTFLNLPDAVDPRIHFAAGATHTMRPMFVYSSAKIDLELEYVARIYCRNVEFVWMETTTNILTLTPYIKTYMADFASTKNGLPKALMPFMREKAHIDEMLTVHKKIKVEFHDDVKNDGWNDYAGEHFLYESTPKADIKGLVHKDSDEPRKEMKRRGSFTDLFRPTAS